MARLDPNKKVTRDMSIDQQKMWKISVEKEEQLRLKWFKKNEDRLVEIANKEITRKVPDAIKEEMKKSMIHSFQSNKKHAVPTDENEDSPLVDSRAIHNIMKPVDKATRNLLYRTGHNDGRITYLKERVKLIPEEKYYFPETTNFQYGWHTWHLFKQMHGSPFARQQVIRNSFYRRRGVERDPDWYKEPARLSPMVCGCI